MARPQIPDVIKNRVENIHERHRDYPANSFQEALSTVTDIAERTVRETKLDERLPFQYEVEDRTTGIIIRLRPEPESEIKIDRGKLKTENIELEITELFEELKQIDGVRNSSGSHGETINAVFENEPERSFDKIVDDIFVVLAEAIQRKEETIEQIEERAGEYASPKEPDSQ